MRCLQFASPDEVLSSEPKSPGQFQDMGAGLAQVFDTARGVASCAVFLTHCHHFPFSPSITAPLSVPAETSAGTNISADSGEIGGIGRIRAKTKSLQPVLARKAVYVEVE